ncbi:PBP1A family penicillin-binding protein [candidate division KSB1 bacterium]|nr:PBP1A family penicillin-binding protein [candidate division KSB1 bacterium]
MRRIPLNVRPNMNNYAGNSGRSKKGILFVAIFFIAFIILSFGVVLFLSRDLPSLTQLEQYEPELATKVYSRDGVIIKELFTQKRMLISLDDMPDYVWQSVVATEDHIFYDHWGLNIPRFVKAMFVNIASMNYQQGASTITQQLARQLYLGLEKKISRKLKEWITAIQIERTYTKHEILEMYLNYMNFGHGNYGVQAASLAFFDKNAHDLTLDEAALLAGLLQRPTSYSPYNHLDRAVRRRDIVLSNMLRRKYITQEQYDAAIAIQPHILPRNSDDEYGIGPYFTEYVRQELQQRYQMDLYKDGFSVYTTLDSRVQAAADSAVKAHLPYVQERFNKRFIEKDKILPYIPENVLKKVPYEKLKADSSMYLDSLTTAVAPVQVALVAMDPTNGHILAMIGGRDFGQFKFNRALQAHRQPGSTFKPIVYTAAIDNGYPPTTRLLNQPIVLYLPNGDRWAPANYDHSKGGPTTFREGLRRSLNLVTARVVQEIVPPKTIVDYAHKLGLTTEILPVDAIALGSADVIPIEMISAFAVFANGGALAKPMGILQVKDKYGNTLEDNRPQLTHVLRAETAYIMVDLLKTVINRGTGAGARSRYHFLRPAGGKTGTTNDFTDAWFIGFTTQIVAGVWIGLDDPSETLGPGVAGSVAALPIWAPFMKMAHDTLDLPIEDFHMPPGVVRVDICDETQMVASEFCPSISSEVFEQKNAPVETCTKHRGFGSSKSFNRDTTEKKKRIRF